MMEGTLTKGQGIATAVVRITAGAMFLTAGIEKAIGGGFNAAGFLKGATAGTPYLATAAEKVVYNPTHDLWVSLAANATLMPLVNWLVVAGEIAIGVALILGLATRFAAVAGGLMMGLFYLALWDLSHGIVNEQLLLGVTTLFLGVIGAGRYYGIDAILEKAQAVRQAPQLRYVLG
jgi:thiosulfate dehydrogenase (quinone) large subunit